MEIVIPPDLDNQLYQISTWHTKENASVKKGEMLAQISPQKDSSLSQSIKSPTDGILQNILVPDGGFFLPTTPIAIIGTILELPSTIKIFYCYAHEDETILADLKKHMGTLRKQGIIYDGYDHIGSEKSQGVTLDSADIILLLISRYFIDSDYCYNVEMKQAIEKHEQGKARVVPVWLRPVDGIGSPFAKLQGLPTNLNPVTQWNDHDQAFLDIVQGIRRLIQEINKDSLIDIHKYIEDIKKLDFSCQNMANDNSDKIYHSTEEMKQVDFLLNRNAKEIDELNKNILILQNQLNKTKKERDALQEMCLGLQYEKNVINTLRDIVLKEGKRLIRSAKMFNKRIRDLQ